MIFEITGKVQHLIVLGAGASVDYRLPTWKELSPLISERVKSDTKGEYKFHKEILNWLDSIGEGKKYETLDECIVYEAVASDFHDNGPDIENQIFLITKDIFDSAYNENNTGWIRSLNEKILYNAEQLESSIAFINYNYDGVLDKNFLDFDYLPAKNKLYLNKARLEKLHYATADVLYPHGYFSEESTVRISHLNKHAQTMKDGNGNHLPVVSCHESFKHAVVPRFGNTNGHKLYILGLGGGLEVNLNNILFKEKISEIHITVWEGKNKNEIINFLSNKFKVSLELIHTYSSCNELIDACF